MAADATQKFGRAFTPASIEFQVISYDTMLTKNTAEFMAKHPGREFHEVIDIIRALADKEFLDDILSYSEQDKVTAAADDVTRPLLMQQKTLIYLDRNNTPDIWPDIQKAIAQQRNSRTILILPTQMNVPAYRCQNPLSPAFFFECCNRIFKRPKHECLSSDNKPKVIEVLLKFQKLYDGCRFDDRAGLEGFFDEVVECDFMGKLELSEACYNAITYGLNHTPEEFKPPTDAVIDLVVKAVDDEILRKAAYAA